ncbi:hypothetical protein N8968_03125 [Candidatus Pelagibacter sp.]|jgi:hypothetical protein|nr:hypothetical protein [Candidatus Pelagibacter sp.]
MRRTKLITKKVIILVILSGFFNLLSYAFDQLVIQSEFKNRNLERVMVENRVSLEALSYEINTLNDLSFDIIKSISHFNHHLPITLFGSINFLSDDSHFSWDKTFLNQNEKVIGKDFLKKFKEIIPDFNNKVEEMYKIILLLPPVEYSFSLNDYKIDPNIFDKFNPLLRKGSGRGVLDDENYEVYSEIYTKINKFKAFSRYTDYRIKTSEEEYVIKFSEFYSFLEKFSKQQNKMNFYILFSIISQILGILFMLLLFKSILYQGNISNV